MQFKRFIEDNFLIDDKDTGALVPFKFRRIQERYYKVLCNDYSEADNFKGLREIDLKARKEGFTSMWLGIFCADMCWNPNPVRYLEISYKDDATSQHFTRAKKFVLSFFEKDLAKWNKDLDRLIFSKITDGTEFILRHNGASFYVGTASTKTGERGGTVQGVLFTEAAHFPDTGLIKASEIIEGTKSMVAVGSGMVIQETTADGYNFFKKTWDMAVSGMVDYKPRFFSWKEFYSEEEYKQICNGFTDKRLIPQEFPSTPEEAFLTSGECYFDKDSLADIMLEIKNQEVKTE